MGDRLDYEYTHTKIKKAIDTLLASGGKLSVKKVADLAGISKSTAYNHGCDEMIREILKEENK